MMSAIYRMKRRASRNANDEAGFSMVEMVMGIFIFAMVIGGVVVGMSSALNVTRQNRNRSIAANLAAQEMDTARSTEFTDLPLGVITTTQSVDGVPYTIERETEWVYPNATSGPCQAPSGSTLAYLSIVVRVSWKRHARRSARDDIHGRSPRPSERTIPLTGHIGVMVRDAAAVPQENTSVSISGPGVTESQTTSADGCAFFAFEPIGAYTVTLSRAGYVSDQLLTGPTQSATVGAGSTVSLQFQYDQAATMNLTLAGSAGGAIPNGIGVTLWNTHLLPGGKKSFTNAGASASQTLPGLFPYVDGYEMFAGSCLAADPEGMNGAVAIYPGASRPAATSVTPGGTSSAAVPLRTLIVQTRTGGERGPPGRRGDREERDRHRAARPRRPTRSGTPTPPATSRWRCRTAAGSSPLPERRAPRRSC